MRIEILSTRGDTCWGALMANPKGRLPRGSVDGGNWVGFRTFRPMRQVIGTHSPS